MLSDARFHNDNHILSVMEADRLTNTFVRKMSFEEEDVVMIIGCGSGDNAKNIFLRRIPKLKKLIGIDIMPEMIDFARLHYADEKIEYHVADIQDRSSLKEWEGSASKVFSVHCFHWVKDQRKAFQSLYDLLRPEGEAVFVFMLSTAFWACYPIVVSKEKWNKYLKDVDQCVPESHYLHLGSDFFKNVFEELGFEVLLCEEENIIKPLTDKIKYTIRAHSSLTKHIPDELKDEFDDDLLDEYLKRSLNSEGVQVYQLRQLTVHLRKPETARNGT